MPRSRPRERADCGSIQEQIVASRVTIMSPETHSPISRLKVTEAVQKTKIRPSSEATVLLEAASQWDGAEEIFASKIYLLSSEDRAFVLDGTDI